MIHHYIFKHGSFLLNFNKKQPMKPTIELLPNYFKNKKHPIH